MLQRLLKRLFRRGRRPWSRPPEIWTTPWTAFPYGTEAASHLFAVGDVHGCDDLLAPLLDHLAAQDGEAPAMIVFTGDLIDRGPGSIRALNLVQDSEERFDRTILLPGNHEIALLKAMCTSEQTAAVRTWISMGGDAVLREINADPLPRAEQLQMLRQALPAGMKERLRTAPGWHKDRDILLVHAGIPPSGDRQAFLAQGPFDRNPWLRHWSTIRQPFLSWRGGWDGTGAPGRTLVVHGHTPVTKRPLPSLEAITTAADLAMSHGRIDIDLGSTRSGMIGALEIKGRHYRMHVARQA